MWELFLILLLPVVSRLKGVGDRGCLLGWQIGQVRSLLGCSLAGCTTMHSLRHTNKVIS